MTVANTQDNIIEIFSMKRVSFESHQDAHAREFKSQQNIRWQNLSGSILQTLSSIDADDNFRSRVALLLNSIANISVDQIKISSEDGRYIVESALPLLDQNYNYPNIIHSDVRFVVAAIIAEAYAIFMSKEFANNHIDIYEITKGPISILVAEYLSRKAFVSSEARRQLDQNQTSFSKIFDDMHSKNQTVDKRIDVSIERYNKTIEQFGEMSKNSIVAFEASAARKLEAHLAAQSEFERIKRPVDLWTANASRHKRSFWLGLLALLTLVVAAAYAALKGLPRMIESLGISNTDASGHFTPATTLVLATIIALLAAAGFVVKIIGRFVTNALTLAEDAEVRAALADTFIGLTAEDTTLDEKARDQARTVMLAVLFRPLPGHQQEEITAPTVLSLAQDMLGKKADKA